MFCLLEDLQEFEENGESEKGSDIEEYTAYLSKSYSIAYAARISHRFYEREDFVGDTETGKRRKTGVYDKTAEHFGNEQLGSGDIRESRSNNVDEGSSPEEGASFSFEESRKNLSKDINDFFDSIDNASVSNILFESGLSSAKSNFK